MINMISGRFSKTPSSKLRKFNNLLSFLVIGLGLYIALVPVLPVVELWWKQRGGVNIPYSGALSSVNQNAKKDNQPVPKENRLVIPGIAINEEIKEGSSLWVIENNGVWRRPSTSADPLSSNMVIVGHRFTYTHPYGTFYHLDKLKIGDKLALYWQQKEYVYEVVESKVVSPDNSGIESPSADRRLTLYTCTPIWSAKDRLVITALPVEIQP